MIDSSKVLYSEGKNDECYTPYYGVEPILEYIPKDSIVWCPFDTKESEFVKQISKTNKVVFSHIKNGQDFLVYEPKKWDIIISNPPFTNKREFFKRALSFNKPFALIMTILGLMILLLNKFLKIKSYNYLCLLIECCLSKMEKLIQELLLVVVIIVGIFYQNKLLLKI